jgi:catechol 2,3-dioxygenase-like lactoylglutathione lyase family enzyme
MSRVQLSINVSDFDAAVAFYCRLSGAALAKPRPTSPRMTRRSSWC